MSLVNFREKWAQLRARTPLDEDGGYRMQFMTTCRNVRIYAATTLGGREPALVLDVVGAVRLAATAVATGRVLKVKVGEFPGLPEGRSGVALELHDPSFEDLFEHLGQDIIAAIGDSDEPDIGTAISKCIQRWRSFVEQGNPPMSGEEVRGLLGELVVLDRCIGRFGAREALQAWVGPLGGLRDFQLPDASVEVKTFQSDTGAVVRFNDPQQLDADDQRPVYVAAVRLARCSKGGVTLPQAIQRIREHLHADQEVLAMFEQRLTRCGYVAAFAQLLEQQYRAGRPVLYRVRDDFPRIRPGDIPPGVQDVHFSVPLAALRAFLVETELVLGEPAASLEQED